MHTREKVFILFLPFSRIPFPFLLYDGPTVIPVSLNFLSLLYVSRA